VASLVVISICSYVSWDYYQDVDMVDLINQEMAVFPSASGKQAFNVLDATKYTDSMYPWIGDPVVVLSELELLGAGSAKNVPPDELKVKQALYHYEGKKRVILHIPSWSIDANKEQDIMTNFHIEWYLKILQWAKEALPDSDIGILGVPYSPWAALKSTKYNMHNYQRVYELIKPILAASDTLYPLFQVYSHEKSDLYFLMGASLYIAKASDKPVYPVISRKSSVMVMGDDLIPVDFINQQCTFIRSNADGMVVWSTSIEQWDKHWYDAVSEQCFL